MKKIESQRILNNSLICQYLSTERSYDQDKLEDGLYSPDKHLKYDELSPASDEDSTAEDTKRGAI